MTVDQFERSQVPFFSSKETKRALTEIVKRKHVVIYCGAGVTIDRTGLGWKQLISSALRPTKPSSRDSLYISDADIESLPDLIDAQRLATILTGYCKDKYPQKSTRQQQIYSWLRNALYEESGWQSGTLATNIARYAVAAASEGSQVSLITTNYDIYLEEELREEIKRFRFASRLPGIEEVSVPTFKPIVIRNSAPDSYPSEDINLIYLHGKLPRSANPIPPIVVDELDYAETRARTIQVLSEYLRITDSALIIVGASLTDPPLIDALALDADSTRNDRQYRVYFTPVSSFRISSVDSQTMERLVKHVESRCRRLGFNQMLTADFKFQTAQLFEELIVCTVKGAAEYSKPNSTFAYNKRLDGWREKWEADAKLENNVRDANDGLCSEVSRIAEEYCDSRGGNKESFKLEIWARDESQRQLVIWASSVGIPTDRSTMKRAPLAINSSRASIRSFTEGRVMHLDATELGLPEESYWRSFLTIPIYLDREDTRLFAGVITLVSSSAKGQTNLPTGEVDKMRALVTQLTDQGARVLGFPTA